MSLYVCFCEVDHDCAPVSQWCDPCREHAELSASPTDLSDEDHEALGFSVNDELIKGSGLVGYSPFSNEWYWEAGAISHYGSRQEYSSKGETSTKGAAVNAALQVFENARRSEREMMETGK